MSVVEVPARKKYTWKKYSFADLGVTPPAAGQGFTSETIDLTNAVEMYIQVQMVNAVASAQGNFLSFNLEGDTLGVTEELFNLTVNASATALFMFNLRLWQVGINSWGATAGSITSYLFNHRNVFFPGKFSMGANVNLTITAFNVWVKFYA